MAAGKHGSSEVTFTLDDAPGGTGRAIQGHITEAFGVKIESAQEASQAFGDAWEESTPSGSRKGAPIPVGGFFDDTATTGPHAVLSSPDYDPQAAARNLVIVFGNAKTVTTTVRLTDYEVTATVGKLHKFKATLQPTGAITWS